MKKNFLFCAAIFFLLTPCVHANGFIENSTTTLSARNFYFENDNREHDSSAGQKQEWGQGFRVDFRSGYTPGPVGFGLDLIGIWGLRLDSGGQAGKPDISRNPGELFPLRGDGTPRDEFAAAGATAKIKASDTVLRAGTLLPRYPILVSNDGRLLPQWFQGVEVQSREVDKLTLVAGRLNRVKDRNASGRDKLSSRGASARTDEFLYGGAEYSLTDSLELQYYYGQLRDYYRQHFLGLRHRQDLPVGRLDTDLRYFHSRGQGRNRDDAAYPDYGVSGYYGDGRTRGEVDNDTWSAFFNYRLAGHSLGVGYQQVSGDSDLPYIIQDSGATVYLNTFQLINNFSRAGERTAFVKYGYDFAKIGVSGLAVEVAYLHGDSIRSADGDLSEWERDFRITYSVPSGPLKGLTLGWLNASLRSEAVNDTDQNRLIVAYSVPLP